MTAEIIQFRPKPNPNREKELERQAMEIANICFPSIVCTGNDTAPAEYVAPMDDPA